MRPINRQGIQNTTETARVQTVFKAHEAKISFDFGSGGDPTNGPLENSKTKKVDAMVVWDCNLFVR